MTKSLLDGGTYSDFFSKAEVYLIIWEDINNTLSG